MRYSFIRYIEYGISLLYITHRSLNSRCEAHWMTQFDCIFQLDAMV